MKVRVVFDKPSYHPKFGQLKPGDEIDIPDEFPVDGKLFRKIRNIVSKGIKAKEVKDV